ncbi:MAG: hypothetical protein F6K36_13735 [Symploca sp. SIO3C6]|uniref:Chromosome segregation ATPase n=1 Tax=Symploca sp. SIO1C4 TaxID=2607765 RepID=A0A6B3MZA8_9CYAN|nr:hypothetical protein [Symploca sp. SIO3C6]NER26776.1 hypothetical protein [Symploca sp. SIO1C4]
MSNSQEIKDLPPKNFYRSGEDPSTQTQYHHRRLWLWWLLWSIFLALLGGGATSAIWWLTKLPPPINCQSISPLSADGERLYCAQKAADSGQLQQLLAAISLVENWSQQHPLYGEAQRRHQQWSKAIMAIAQQKINQGELTAAVKIAQQLPVTSPLYAQVQATITAWQGEWQQGELITGRFEDALKRQNWEQASRQIGELTQLKEQYWNLLRFDQLIQELDTEKQAWQQLEKAQNLASSGYFTHLEQAITLAGKVSPSSYVKAQAKAKQSQWGRTLLQLAAERFEKQDFTGVISIAEQIPVNTSVYEEALDWIRLSRASEIANKNNLPALVDALAAVAQISSRSPLAQLASQQTAKWSSELQAYTQLELAKFVAGFEQLSGLQMAIEQAALIEPGNRQRLRAQTLIAQWRQGIEQIEDRQVLLQAQDLAEASSIERLRAAVEVASKIKLGQTIHPKAQSAIAKWHQQIQFLEDQALLDEAKVLAQKQDFSTAIATAQQISSQGELYPQAQEAIANWQAEIEASQDLPILDAASALAAQGRFEAAIATASFISPERALYKQAQALKKTWQSQQTNLSNGSFLSNQSPNVNDQTAN